MSEIERQRDAALIGYNECRATIEDARRVLGATAHEGLLLAAMRVTEQRDRLAEELRTLIEERNEVCNQRDAAFERYNEAVELYNAAVIGAKLIDKDLKKAESERDKLEKGLKDLINYANSFKPFFNRYQKRQTADTKGDDHE